MTDVAPELLSDWTRNLDALAGQYSRLQPAAQQSLVGRLLQGSTEELHRRDSDLDAARNDLLLAMARQMGDINAVMSAANGGWAGPSPFSTPDFTDLIIEMGWDRPSGENGG